MLTSVARPSRSANGSFERSSDISATSAVSSATSVPATPIAMPTSAAASAGASLMPSPTMATGPYAAAQRVNASTLSRGQQLGVRFVEAGARVRAIAAHWRRDRR